MYSIGGYGRMIADPVRTDAYAAVLRRAIRPDATVIDIGAGTGFFALMACRLGARRVYAIEPDDAIHVAREIAAANGFADRIEFIQDLSTRIRLPERADVIISDLRGVLPLLGQHIPSIADARKRLLAPGGTLIPRRDHVWVSIVDTPEVYDRHVGRCDDRYGFDLRAARQMVSNTWRKARVQPEQLLVEPRCWATLDYRVIEDPDVRGELCWTAQRAGTAHGVFAWFDAELADGIGFSNAPGAPELLYGGAFFPFASPVGITPGDTVSVTLQARLVGDDYVWSWDTCVQDPGRPNEVKARFEQSTFLGAPLSPAQLRRQAAGYRPLLNEDGRMDQLALTLMDGGDSSLDEIARRLCEHFPDRFRRWEEALGRVGELSKRYSLR